MCVCLCLDILVVVCNMTVDKNVLSASLNKTFAYFLLQLLQLLNVLPVPLAIAAPINHVPRELNIGHVCSPRHNNVNAGEEWQSHSAHMMTNSSAARKEMFYLMTHSTHFI